MLKCDVISEMDWTIRSDLSGLEIWEIDTNRGFKKCEIMQLDVWYAHMINGPYVNDPHMWLVVWKEVLRKEEKKPKLALAAMCVWGWSTLVYPPWNRMLASSSQVMNDPFTFFFLDHFVVSISSPNLADAL